uniref:Uncharacterized protein n=1 Tax=Arion vulgaris TaxID=1028688 RepID=A0A0B6ZMA6_9EUPU
MSYSAWRKHIAGQLGFNFHVTDYPLTANFNHPGLNYSNFDHSGNIEILSLLSFIVDVRMFPEHYPYKENMKKWFDFGELHEDRSIFMSSIEVVLSPNMYNKQIPKWPLETKVRLGYIGNSSVAIHLEVYTPGGQEPLLTHVVQMVSVDTKTRKPKQFPDWFMNKYKDQCSMKEGFRLRAFQRPQKTFTYRREVMWLETDFNQHTNFASYVRYALDGLHSALKRQNDMATASHHSSSSESSYATNDVSGAEYQSSSTGAVSDMDKTDRLEVLQRTVVHTKNSIGGLKGISKDVIKRGIKSLKACYLNECLEGDIIDVHVWQEDNEPYTVRCSVEKGSKILCQIILEYFGPLAKL